ncbi:hypothetical protein LJC17_02695 [Acholeplasma sp. OttesenSCG-928-E16]|nr:hypothetical protein [Acholeplasma sp. OttesenSCG-928-E16]
MKAALIGKNIQYSLSPIIHQYISKKYSLNYHYQVIDTDNLKEIDFFSYLFLNITTPYKETMLDIMVKDDVVNNVSATNLVVPKNNQLYAFNTDYLGFLALLKINKINIKNKKIFILGYGGAAKAVAYAIKNENPTIVVKTDAKRKPSNYLVYENLIDEYPDIIINATPNKEVLSKDLFNNKTISSALLIDLNYNPSPTYLMTYFKNSIDGLDMLIAQAFLGVKIAFNNDKIVYEKEDQIKIRKLL